MNAWSELRLRSQGQKDGSRLDLFVRELQPVRGVNPAHRLSLEDAASHQILQDLPGRSRPARRIAPSRRPARQR